MKVGLTIAILASLAISTASADEPADEAAEETADFTLHVPVEIENTIIWTISVSCVILENDYVDGRMGGTTMLLVGRGSASATVVDGDFNGTLVVTVDAEPGTFPALAKSYSCSLSAAWPLDPQVGFQQGVGDYMASPGNFADVYERRGGRLLTSYLTTVRGSISQ